MKNKTYGELIKDFIDSLPNPSYETAGYKVMLNNLSIYCNSSNYELIFNMFDELQTHIQITKGSSEYNLFGVNNTDLEGNLKKIYTIMVENEVLIRETFQVNNSAILADIDKQIEDLQNKRKEYEN